MYNNLAENKLLNSLYDAPWTIRRNQKQIYMDIESQTGLKPDEAFASFYKIKSNQECIPLNTDNNFQFDNIAEIELGASTSFPELRCLTTEVPSSLNTRAGKTFNTPKVNLIEISHEVSISLNYDLPLVVDTHQSSSPVINILSHPNHNVLNIRGGKQLLKSNQIVLDGIYFFNDTFGANNYAHWLLDWVPRLKFLTNNPDYSDLSLVFNMNINKAQKQILNKLKIKPQRIVQVRKGSLTSPLIFVTNRLVSSTICGENLRHPSHLGSSWALDFIRSIFLDGKEKIGNKRIVINRKGTRKLMFSEKSLNLLNSMGFVEICLEDLNVDEQAILFNQSEIIIAAHGAGLSNLVFCNSNAKVLEIFPEDYSTSAFFVIASSLNLDYKCAVGISLNSVDLKHLRDYDILVPDYVLKSFL